MRNHSYENDFHLQVQFHANEAHFHENGFAPGLIIKQRHKGIFHEDSGTPVSIFISKWFIMLCFPFILLLLVIVIDAQVCLLNEKKAK